MLTYIILNIDPLLSEPLWARLADLGAAFLVMGIMCYGLYRQLTKLEARLNKYMEEDRKIMMDVISNNTRAFDRMTEHLDKK